MEITELKPPRPFAKPRRLVECDFKISSVLPIPKVSRKRLPHLDEVLSSRQSRRDFQTPLTRQQLGDLLWHATRLRQGRSLASGTTWESRPAPSGGGCHPVRVLVLQAPVLSEALLVYFAEHHVFGVCELPGAKQIHRCVAEVEKCLAVGNGTVLWFVADLARSACRYKNPESLAWRDSGALLATVGLVAEGLGLNCCGLGLHDIPSLRQLLHLPSSAIGVGGCIVSGRS
jgi:nitroreductase